MKVAYVAGPYRASTPYQTLLNVQEASRVSLELWKMGYAVICPHKNTSMFDGECEELIWLNGYLEILKRCDIVIITHNWDESDGAIKEVAFADSLGIPVMSFHKGLVEIKDFLNEDRKCPV
jgi:hypothetical protein